MGRHQQRRRLRLVDFVHINATLYVLLAYDVFLRFLIDFSLQRSFIAACMFILFAFNI